MTAYLFTAPSGFVGDCSRPDVSNIEPALLITPFPANFGVAMKNATGGVTPMVAADVATSFAGLLIRSVPGISQNSANEQVNTFQPNQSEVNGLMVRGYAFVKVAQGTPVRGQAVEFCNTAGSGHVAGTFEAGHTASFTIPLTATQVGNVVWASDGVDANGMGEIRIAE